MAAIGLSDLNTLLDDISPGVLPLLFEARQVIVVVLGVVQRDLRKRQLQPGPGAIRLPSIKNDLSRTQQDKPTIERVNCVGV